MFIFAFITKKKHFLMSKPPVKMIALLFFILAILKTNGQSPKTPEFILSKTSLPIVVDGLLNDEAWKSVPELSPFNQNFPNDTGVAQHQTRVKITHNDEYLFISAVCYQKKYVVRSLRRDFENSSTDIFFVLIDPFKDKLNGYYFAVSPYGVQKEQLIYNGNENNINWDNKWISNASRYEDRYEIEMAIPFKTLRYKTVKGINTWYINFCRNNNIDNEKSSWAVIPRNFRMLDIAFNGIMKWEKAPPNPGPNISLIPYVGTAINKNHLKGTPSKTNLNAGLDAKIGITPSMNLDITVNPDFSQVEVDRQITDLSRFELFFPERRQFFLENSDLFSEYGMQTSNPFFSRRIGIYYNPRTATNVQVPIIAGARISGRLNDKWRLGFMNMQTAPGNTDSLPGINYMIASVQKKVGVRSNIAFMFVNKESSITEKSSKALLQFNRVAGVEFNYGAANGSATGKIFYHQGFTPRHLKEENSMGASFDLLRKRILFKSNILNIGRNFLAEVGYVPRKGIVRNNANISFVFFPKGKSGKTINSFRITPDYDLFYGKADKRFTDWDAGLFFTVLFQNNATLTGSLLRWDYTYLFKDFDPTNKYEAGYKIIPRGSSFTYFSNRFGFQSNFTNKLNYSINAKIGNYFNGNIISLQNNVSYRWQPYGQFSFEVNYNRIRLPLGFNKADFWLVGPKLDLTFSKTVFLTTYLQYNNQNNNININSRFQWRFKPASDFFLVYTDNYYAQDDPQNAIQFFGKKNRAIVAKFTYWFNL